MEGKAIAFVKSAQIIDILKETNRLKLDVIIRYSQTGKAVRGVFQSFSSSAGVVLGEISAAGSKVLQNIKTVRVEFVLLSKKVYFVTQVIDFGKGSICLAIPKKIIALERRKNMRFTVPKELAAFVEFENRWVDLKRWDAPFHSSVFCSDNHKVSVKVRIDDISLGGVGAFTYYPAIADLIHPDKGDALVKIYIPGIDPLSVPVSMRWVKKSTKSLIPKEHILLRRVLTKRLLKVGINTSEIALNESSIRVGIQFSEISSELDRAVRLLIKKIQTLETL